MVLDVGILGAGSLGIAIFCAARLSGQSCYIITRSGRKNPPLSYRLIISGDTHEIKVSPKSKDQYDVIIVNVKCYDNKSAAMVCRNKLKENGVVILLQNGLDGYLDFYPCIPKKSLVRGLVYACAERISSDSSRLLDNKIQIILESRTEILDALIIHMSNEIVSIKYSSNYRRDSWRKIIFSSSISIQCAHSICTVSEVKDDIVKRETFKQIVKECMHLYRSIYNDVLDIQWFMDVLDNHPKNFKPSIVQDIIGGNNNELRWLSGALLSRANELQIEMPLNAEIYSNLTKVR